MSSAPDPPPTPPGLSHVDQCVEQFEQALRSCDRPRLKDFLPEGPVRSAVLLELIHVELEFRLKAGEAVRVEEYLSAFPELAAGSETVVGLLAMEHRFRLRRGDSPSLDEYYRRFPDLATTLSQRLDASPTASGQAEPPRAALAIRSPVPAIPGYELLGELGSGGMGVVYKARQLSLNRIVALKLIRKERLANADFVRRFHREIRTAARLSHPNIVVAIDADQVGDLHFFTMEYVEGTDLHRLVQEKGPLPVETACEYIRQAALGLQHAFEQGLVHRDIKPHNLLLATGRAGSVSDRGSPVAHAPGSPQIVKVLDLGLARGSSAEDESSTALTQEGAVMGTPDYIAPEQALEAHSVDTRADLYSLGCTLYYLLTARVPFPGGSMTEKLLKHQLQEPDPVERLRPAVPAEVAAVVRRLMAKRPADRYQTPAELVAALEELASRSGRELQPAPRADARHYQSRSLDSSFSALDGPSNTVELIDSRRHSREAAKQRRLLFQTATGAGVLLTLAALLIYVLTRPATPRGTANPGLSRSVTETTPAPRLPATVSPAAPPSVLDSLDVAQVPAEERFDFQPPELVAVVGEHRQRHVGTVTAVSYSPDGRWVASSGNRQVYLSDAATMRLHRVFSTSYPQFAFAPDGRTLAVLGGTGATIEVWDLTAASPRRKMAFQGRFTDRLAYAPDGRTLAASHSDGTISLWNMADDSGDEAHILKDQRGKIFALGFAPDGRTLACVGEDPEVRLWDVTQKPPRIRDVLKGHTKAVNSLAFSTDGRTLAARSNTGHSVRIWDLGAKPIRQREVTALHNTSGLALSADGRALAVCDGPYSAKAGVLLYDLTADPPPVRDSIYGQMGGACAVAFAPDGRSLVCGSTEGVLQKWDPTRAPPRELAELRGPLGPVNGLNFLADGQTLAAVTSLDQTLRLWNLAATPPVAQVVLPDKEFSREFPWLITPDGRLFAVSQGSNQVRILERTADSLKVRENLRGILSAPMNATMALVPSGEWFAAACTDGTVRVWDLRTTPARVKHVIKINGGNALGVALSPDGHALAAACPDKAVRLWNLTVQPPRERTAVQDIAAAGLVAFSPDGHSLAVNLAVSLGVVLYDLTTTPPVERTRVKEAAHQVLFSPDGRFLATYSTSYGVVSVWDLTTGKRRLTWAGPGFGKAIAFAPDSRHLAVGHATGTIYLLRLAQPQPVDGTRK